MPTARGFFGSCVLNGKIYAIGGATSPIHFTSAVEVYDPNLDTWAQKANIPMALCYPNVCTLNGKIYVFGGSTAILGGAKEGAVPVSDVTMYDPSSDTWTKKTDMPTPRSMFTACVFNNKIYAIGGTNEDWGNTFYPNIEEYDPLGDKWTIKTDMLLGRWSPAAYALNNRIYITGGHNGVNAVDRVDILNPETNEWTSGVSMQQVRQGHEACVVDGKIYVLGGCYPEKGMPKFLSSMEVFCIGSDLKP